MTTTTDTEKAVDIANEAAARWDDDRVLQFVAWLTAEIESALAKEREATWHRAIQVVQIIEAGTPDSLQWREGISSVIKTLQDEAARNEGNK